MTLGTLLFGGWAFLVILFFTVVIWGTWIFVSPGHRTVKLSISALVSTLLMMGLVRGMMALNSCNVLQTKIF